MAFSLYKILKGILIREENTLDPKEMEIIPGGTAGTKTTLVSSQTADATVTLPSQTTTVVGRDTTDTLTNKTIVVADNTITTEPSGNLVATELNAALAELQGEIDTFDSEITDLNDRVDDVETDLVNHIADTSTHGVTGDLVGTTDGQTLYNKTFANQTTLSDFLVAVQQASVVTTPPMGMRLIYAKNDGFYEKDSNGVESKIGTGSGGGSDIITNNFVGDGSQVNFTLTNTPGAKTNMFVFIQGVEQEQSTFNVSGTTLTFTTPPPNTATIEVKYGISLDIGTPGDGTVTYAKLDPALQSDIDGKEDVANKSTDTNLGTSDTLYPTQNAVKTYVDNNVGGLNVIASSNLTSQSTSSTSYVALTNLTVNVPANGRPVLLQLVGTGGTLSRVTAGNAVQIGFFKDAVLISEQHQRAAGTQISIPPSSYSHVDMSTSGTHTYSVSFKTSTATATSVEQVKLVAIIL